MNDIQKPNSVIVCTHFFGGEFIEGAGDVFEIDSPYFGEVVGKARHATTQELDEAVHLAMKAQCNWAKMPIKERSSVFFKVREILLRDIDTISQIISLENGKTLLESKAGLLKGIEVLEYALSLQNHDSGAKLEVSREVFCEFRRSPLGVVACITPFNFPAMVPMWTIPIALVLGNAVIWKPSEKTPLTSNLLARVFQEAGLSAGLFNVLQGGSSVVEKICEHENIKAVSFVGSSKVAKIVYEKASSFGKRVLALGGAKNHIFLLPDAQLDLCGVGIADSFTGCAGQRCMAASVIIAVGNVNAHIEKIVDRARSMQLGENMGAIITKEQLEFLNKAIERAEQNGAKILLDGRKFKKPTQYSNGYWLGPTILDNVQPNTEAATIELFGPIISIIRVSNISEGLKIENASEYGNACSVFTSSGANAEEIIRHASAGMIGVNIGVPVPREPFSFGGILASKFGHGDITGDGSLDFWSDLKKITFKWQMQKDHNWMS
jgi:malonate-semialdehyde dehydrogenase (acetylating)/methylmalonate-semialdehyde dehydrogenase